MSTEDLLLVLGTPVVAIALGLLTKWFTDRRAHLLEVQKRVAAVMKATDESSAQVQAAQSELSTELDSRVSGFRRARAFRVLTSGGQDRDALLRAGDQATDRVKRALRLRAWGVVALVSVGALAGVWKGVLGTTPFSHWPPTRAEAAAHQPRDTTPSVGVDAAVSPPDPGVKKDTVWVAYNGPADDPAPDSVWLTQSGTRVRGVSVGNLASSVVVSTEWVWALSCRPGRGQDMSGVDPHAHRPEAPQEGLGGPLRTAPQPLRSTRRETRSGPRMPNRIVHRIRVGDRRDVVQDIPVHIVFSDVAAGPRRIWFAAEVNSRTDLERDRSILNERSVRWIDVGDGGDDLKLAPTRALVGNGPHKIALTADGETAWVTNGCDGTVNSIDSATGQVGPAIRVGRGPSAITVGEDGFVWVANKTDGTVTRVAPDDGHTATFAIGSRPKAIATSGGTVWVVFGDKDAMARLNTESETGPQGSGPRPCDKWKATYSGEFASADGRQVCQADDDEVVCHSNPANVTIAMPAGARPAVVDSGLLSTLSAPRKMGVGADFITPGGTFFCGSRVTGIICRSLRAPPWYFDIGDEGACIGRDHKRLVSVGSPTRACGPTDAVPGFISADAVAVRASPELSDNPRDVVATLDRDRVVDVACQTAAEPGPAEPGPAEPGPAEPDAVALVADEPDAAAATTWLHLAGPADLAGRWVSGKFVDLYGDPPDC